MRFLIYLEAEAYRDDGHLVLTKKQEKEISEELELQLLFEWPFEGGKCEMTDVQVFELDEFAQSDRTPTCDLPPETMVSKAAATMRSMREVIEGKVNADAMDRTDNSTDTNSTAGDSTSDPA